MASDVYIAVRDLVAKDELTAALEKLLEEDLSLKQAEQVVLLQARLQKITQEKSDGTISSDEENLERSRIRKAILALVYTIKNPPLNQRKRRRQRLLIGLGLILFLSLTTYLLVLIFMETYEFDIQYKPPFHAAGSQDTITIKQISGRPLVELHIELHGQRITFHKDPECRCWPVALSAFRSLKERENKIKLAPDRRGLDDPLIYSQNVIYIDNELPEGSLFTDFYQFHPDSVAMEVKGRANEQVSIEILLPISADSVRSSFGMYADSTGYYFMQRLSIPISLVEQFKDEQFMVLIRDQAGNQAGSQTTFGKLQNGDMLSLVFGKYNPTMPVHSEPGQVFVLEYPDLSNPQESPTQLPPPNPKTTQPDSLTLLVTFFSPKMIGLKWRLHELSSLAPDVEYTLYRRIAASTIKDTATTFVPIRTLADISFTDSLVKQGYVYEYQVKVQPRRNQKNLLSNTVEQLVPNALTPHKRSQDSIKLDTIFTKQIRPRPPLLRYRPALDDELDSLVYQIALIYRRQKIKKDRVLGYMIDVRDSIALLTPPKPSSRLLHPSIQIRSCLKDRLSSAGVPFASFEFEHFYGPDGKSREAEINQHFLLKKKKAKIIIMIYDKVEGDLAIDENYISQSLSIQTYLVTRNGIEPIYKTIFTPYEWDRSDHVSLDICRYY